MNRPLHTGPFAPIGLAPDSDFLADDGERLERAIDAVARPEGVGLPYVQGWSLIIPLGGPGFHAEIVMPHGRQALRIVEPIGGVSLAVHDYIGDVARAVLALAEPRDDMGGIILDRVQAGGRL